MSDDNQNATEPQKTESNDQISEVARKLITEANNEAAKYRTQRNAIEAETAAKLKAEFDEQFKVLSDNQSAITAERDTVLSDYTKLKVALHAGVPGETAVEFAALLQGSSPDEYQEHADKLKGMFGTPGKQKAVDHTAGFNGETQSAPEDVFAAIFKRNLTQK